MAKKSKVVVTFKNVEEFAEFITNPGRLRLDKINIVGENVTIGEILSAVVAKRRVKASHGKGRVRS